MPYVAIYRASIVAPEDYLTVKLSDVQVKIQHGPFSFSHAVPMKSVGPNGTRVVLGERCVNVPKGIYVVIETAATPGMEREQIALRVAEIASLVTLQFPRVLDEKIYEGPVSTEQELLLWGEGPMTLKVGPAVTASQLLEVLAGDFCSMQRLNANERYRYQLASRWYRRGLEAVNLVDRFLYLWTVLEIYPGSKNTGIVNNLSRVLREKVYPQLSPQDIKDMLLIGHMYGERKRIVHEGRAFVAFDDQQFQGLLSRLQAITTTCVRLLCGLQPGDNLQEFVDPVR